jgi:flagellar protein FliO/FliZ
MILLTISEKSNSALQFITVLFLFILVIGITWATTHFIANYQKVQNTGGGNIALIEAARLGTGKYIQVVRIGEKYVALAVCKDTVTVICEVPKEEIKEFSDPDKNIGNFKDLFTKFLEGNKKTNFDEKQDPSEK